MGNKLLHIVRRVAAKAAYAVLVLYYAATSSAVPKRDKLFIYGAFIYLIWPVDFIPDVLLGVGYMDDATLLLVALRKVWLQITPEVRQKALRRVAAWLG